MASSDLLGDMEWTIPGAVTDELKDAGEKRTYGCKGRSSKACRKPLSSTGARPLACCWEERITFLIHPLRSKTSRFWLRSSEVHRCKATTPCTGYSCRPFPQPARPS